MNHWYRYIELSRIRSRRILRDVSRSNSYRWDSRYPYAHFPLKLILKQIKSWISPGSFFALPFIILSFILVVVLKILTGAESIKVDDQQGTMQMSNLGFMTIRCHAITRKTRLMISILHPEQCNSPGYRWDGTGVPIIPCPNKDFRSLPIRRSRTTAACLILMEPLISPAEPDGFSFQEHKRNVCKQYS